VQSSARRRASRDGKTIGVKSAASQFDGVADQEGGRRRGRLAATRGNVDHKAAHQREEEHGKGHQSVGTQAPPALQLGEVGRELAMEPIELPDSNDFAPNVLATATNIVRPGPCFSA
jgi:hypothetical protein